MVQRGRRHVSCLFLVLLPFGATFAQQCDVTAKAGDAVFIPLGYPGFAGQYNLLWRHNIMKVFDRDGGTVDVGRGDDVTGDGSLLLLNIKKYQEGKYSGELKDGLTLVYKTETFVCVSAQLVYGLMGEELQFDLKVDEPISMVTWEKEGRTIAEWRAGRTPKYGYRCRSPEQCVLNTSTGGLAMKGLMLEDEGRYTADVNAKGPAKEFNLTLLTLVSKPNVSASCNETQCTLTCVGLETKCAKYSWKLNGSTMQDGDGDVLLAHKSGDLYRSYTCVFSNPRSEDESDPVTEMDLFLKVVSKPDVRSLCGERHCTLTCVGKETEYAEYLWKGNGETVKEGSTLTVRRTGFLSQSYSCVFRNPKSQAKSDPVYEMDLFACSSHDSSAAVVLSAFVALAVAGAVVGAYLKGCPCRRKCSRLNCLKKSIVEPCNQVSGPEQVSSVTHS